MSTILRRTATLAARLASSRHGTILCFHGVERSIPIAPTSAHVSLEHFRETIDVACAAAEAVTLREMIGRRTAGKSTAGLFAVTFDDAYLSLGTPPVREVLKGGTLPITIFVVSGASEGGSPFWWDRIETAQRLVAPDAWSDFERAIGVPDGYRTAASLAYGVLRPVRQWVLQQHAGRWPREAAAALDAVEAQAGRPPGPRAMNFDELDTMVRHGALDIGVHTASHPVLPLLGDDEARWEIESSYRALIERFPSTVPWLAAPFGLYDARTSRLAREAGLQGILNLHAFTLAQSSPIHGLPRVNVMETAPPWKLALRLSRFSDMIWKPRAGVVDFPPAPGAD